MSVCKWKRMLACTCFAASTTIGSAIAESIAQGRVQAGLWEITFVQDGTPSTSTYCITPAAAGVMNSDSATVQGYVERAVSKEDGGNCTLKKFELQGNTLSLIKACRSGESEFTVSLVRTYHGDTAESEVVSRAGERELRIKSKQRRVGFCEEDPNRGVDAVGASR